MTVIIENLKDLAGTPETDPVFFSTFVIRDSVDGTAIITTTTHRYLPVNGVLTTGSLEPGPAKVRLGSTTYDILIPTSATPIRLMPLIEAGLPAPPTPQASVVVNGGNFARGQVMTAAQYAALTSTTTPDPGSVFLIY